VLVVRLGEQLAGQTPRGGIVGPSWRRRMGADAMAFFLEATGGECVAASLQVMTHVPPGSERGETAPLCDGHPGSFFHGLLGIAAPSSQVALAAEHNTLEM